MDADLKLLAEASLDVTAAEEAIEEGAFHNARDRLDAASTGLDALRERWPSLSGAERAVVGPAASAVRQRVDAAGKRIPRLHALSEAAPVVDPEQDTEPEAA